MAKTGQHGLASFQVFGTTIDINLGWALVALLIATSLASGVFPTLYHGMPPVSYWAMAVLVVVGLGASIILHELAHTLVGRALGVPIHHITLFALGGVSQLEQEPKTARAELFMALAGPGLSILLGLLFALVAGALNGAANVAALRDAFGYLATLNLFLAAFNLMPAFPMDGGRVLRSAIWMISRRLDRATSIATFIGQGFGMLLIALGVVSAIGGQIVGGLWWILIGLFIHFAATSSRNQVYAQQVLHGVNVAALMTPHLDVAPADITVADFVEHELFAAPHRTYPVTRGPEWIGTVSPEDLLRIPRGQWSTTALSDICKPLSESSTVAVWEDAWTAYEHLLQGEDPVFVLDGDRLAGVLTLKNIRERLRLMQQFPSAHA
jgi:Zn-dependent protease